MNSISMITRGLRRFKSTLGAVELSPNERVIVGESSLAFTDQRGEKTKVVPLKYLRRMCKSNFEESTFQRKDVPIDSTTGKRTGTLQANSASSKVKDISMEEQQLRITWSDGHKSEYTQDWLSSLGRSLNDGLKHWGSEMDLRKTVSVPFEEIVSLSNNQVGMKQALNHLHTYGILLIKNTPADKDSLSAFAAAISGGEMKMLSTQSMLPTYINKGVNSDPENFHSITDGPFRNLYGSIWSTNQVNMVEGTSVADSAYTSDALPVHTDMTYYQYPPGVQVFNMVVPAKNGGESVFVDGFAVVEALRKENPAAFNTLCEVEHDFRCIDTSTGWHLQATGPVIQAKKDSQGNWGDVVMIRHNDLDRLASMPPKDILMDADENGIDLFYEKIDNAFSALDKLLSNDRFRVVIKLDPGETVAVANHRTLHGRQSFLMESGSSRSVSGCYVSNEELESRFRVLGLK